MIILAIAGQRLELFCSFKALELLTTAGFEFDGHHLLLGELLLDALGVQWTS